MEITNSGVVHSALCFIRVPSLSEACFSNTPASSSRPAPPLPSLLCRAAASVPAPLSAAPFIVKRLVEKGPAHSSGKISLGDTLTAIDEQVPCPLDVFCARTHTHTRATRQHANGLVLFCFLHEGKRPNIRKVLSRRIPCSTLAPDSLQNAKVHHAL